MKSGRSENGVSFLTYFRFPSSHTTVRAVRHTAVSCLSCPFWTPHIGHRHFFSIVGIRPIVLKREFLFGHLTTTVSKYTDCLVRQCTIRPFALTVTRSATSASADSSTFFMWRNSNSAATTLPPDWAASSRQSPPMNLPCWDCPQTMRPSSSDARSICLIQTESSLIQKHVNYR